MNKNFLDEAIKESKKSLTKDEVPVGAVIVKDNKIIARAHNLVESKKTSTKHAEILAIEKACKAIGDWRLNECEIYVTLEPCEMCLGAIKQSRIEKIYYGLKTTAVKNKVLKKKKSSVNQENTIRQIIQTFFLKKRK